jgi:hypothetical protein
MKEGRWMMEKLKYPYYVLQEAKRHSNANYKEINRAILCGCYGCENVFLSDEIKDWIGLDCRGVQSATAVCPFCGRIAVIAEDSSYPLKKDFLREMRKCWYKEGC